MNDTNPAGTPAKSWIQRHPKWSIFLVLMMLGIVVSSLGDATTSSNPSPEPQQVVEDKPNGKVGIGEEGILNYHEDVTDCSQTSIVAVDEETHKAIVTASIAKDTYALSEFVVKGKAFLVPNCTKVKVIDQGFGRRKIRVSEGEQINKAGWVSMEFVRAI